MKNSRIKLLCIILLKSIQIFDFKKGRELYAFIKMQQALLSTSNITE